jgi:hypothetical protein
MWLRLDKPFFKLKKDLYIAVCYKCPNNSSYANKSIEFFETLESDIAKYSALGSTLVCGDFNGRTGTTPDYCSNDIIDELITLPYTYFQDVEMNRANIDTKPIDSNGEKLLNLCKASGLRIINGRFFGDCLGYYTCFNHIGAPSVIDYMLGCQSVLPLITSFHVMDPTEFSIHNILSLNLNISLPELNSSSNNNLKDMKCFKWKTNDALHFQKILLSSKMQDRLAEIESSTSNSHEQLENDLQALTDILIDSATKAGITSSKPQTPSKNPHKTVKKKKFKWFDQSCSDLKKFLNRLAHDIRINPSNSNLIQTFKLHRKKYKRLLNAKKKEYENNLTFFLENLEDNNPTAFWKVFNELKNLDKQKHKNPIPPEEWKAHFFTLFNQSLPPSDEQELFYQNFIEMNKNNVFNKLNYKITNEEIKTHIQKLKNGKSSGIDSILNEMIKAGSDLLLPILNKLFNEIFTHGDFPKIWRTNTLTPIHKKGSQNDSGNYRGIAVSSNLAKLFCSIIHSRLSLFIKENKLIPTNQIGYKKGCRTSDHILTLKNIIDKYLSRIPRSYLYTCFVDFKSAFDTVSRNALLYKLINLNIGGQFLNIIKSMYSEVSYCIKLDNKLTDSIPSNIGVKQGCVLSPTLFNLFLSDLPYIFDVKCNPVEILNEKQNCLMFADDIVLFSESSTGLQNCLNKLNDYCTKWKLTVNINKTKIIIFNKGGHSIKKFNFLYGEENIEIVQNYCYLGICFSSCGSFNLAMKNILDKSMKAFYKLKQLNTRNCPKLTIKLFNFLVLPIANYGSEVWSPFQIKNKNLCHDNFMTICDNLILEKLNIKLCKYILGVHKFTSNNAVRGELGCHPLLINFWTHSIKYWLRLQALDPNDHMVKKSYIDSTFWASDKTISWPSYVHKILFFLGKDELWNSQCSEHAIYHNICETKSLLKLIYKNKWSEFIKRNDTPNKLLNYSTFKENFKLENYILTVPLEKRKNFTKLRISAHDLEIEKGRHNRPKVPSHQRICKYCETNSIENECHFLLYCPLYNYPRSALKNELLCYKPTSVGLVFEHFESDKEIFIALMNYLDGNPDIAKIICKYVDTCFSIRSALKNTNNHLHDFVTHSEFLRLSYIMLDQTTSKHFID